MSLDELMAEVKGLTRIEKLELAQFLLAEGMREEGGIRFPKIDPYDGWSQRDAFGAASTLTTMLAERKRDKNG